MSNRLASLFRGSADTLFSGWVSDLNETLGDTRIAKTELHQQAREFLDLTSTAIAASSDIQSEAWAPTRRLLEDISRSRATQGFNWKETAAFVFSLKKALFVEIQREFSKDAATAVALTAEASQLVDALGMHTVQAFQQSREDIIRRQQEELLELSTPVVKLWEGILALPMIGTLDSARTQVVMESLLQRIVETGSEVAIIDITGVPTVDTLVAQHLLKTVTAIRLMGADCIISGIRPQIAQTIVHLGVDLRGVTTKANLADALAIALDRSGLKVVSK